MFHLLHFSALTTSIVPVVLMDILGPEDLPKAYALENFNIGLVFLLPTPFAGLLLLINFKMKPLSHKQGTFTIHL